MVMRSTEHHYKAFLEKLPSRAALFLIRNQGTTSSTIELLQHPKSKPSAGNSKSPHPWIEGALLCHLLLHVLAMRR